MFFCQFMLIFLHYILYVFDNCIFCFSLLQVLLPDPAHFGADHSRLSGPVCFIVPLPLTCLLHGGLVSSIVVGITYMQYWQDRIMGFIVALAPLWPQPTRPMSKTSRMVLTPINTSMCHCPNVYNINMFTFVYPKCNYKLIHCE